MEHMAQLACNSGGVSRSVFCPGRLVHSRTSFLTNRLMETSGGFFVCKLSMQKASEQRTVVPVIETMPADLLTPLAVYLKLAGLSETSFLFESVEGGESLARYSFIGAEPVFTAAGNGERAEIDDGENNRTIRQSVFDFVRDHFSRNVISGHGDLPGFSGGAIALINFEAVAWMEPKLGPISTHSDHDATFIFFRTVIAFDHAKQQIKIVTLVFPDDHHGGGDVDSAAAKNREIRQVLETASIPSEENGGSQSEQPVSSNFSKQDFEAAVREAKELIHAGDVYQVVLSQRFTVPTNSSPISIYRAMRSLNPSPYMFLIRIKGIAVIGASPEMLVRCRENRTLEYRPIAGTRQRGRNADEDAELAAELGQDQKEVAEHMMLVDLGRNDLGRVARYGSVKVADMLSVEKYSHVQHLVSYLSAELRPDRDRFDALASCFPAGTVSGAPKIRAIEVIRQLEPDRRGLYSGCVGYFDHSGNMDTCIAIRTLILKDGVAAVQAGAGIVADSVPEREYEETVNKAAAMLKSVAIADEYKI